MSQFSPGKIKALPSQNGENGVDLLVRLLNIRLFTNYFTEWFYEFLFNYPSQENFFLKEEDFDDFNVRLFVLVKTFHLLQISEETSDENWDDNLNQQVLE